MTNRSKNRHPYGHRQINFRPTRKVFLIVCEGEKTEPNYFRGFRVPKNVADVYGVGMNTRSLVEKTIELRDKGEYDQAWCVFDRDSFPTVDFNEAFSLARRNKIKVAYSNEAFELWYLLHYHFHNTALGRADYCSKLASQLGSKYEKNRTDIFEILEPHQAKAIDNAERLLASYESSSPHKNNPSTTVHMLVKELVKEIKRNSDK